MIRGPGLAFWASTLLSGACWPADRPENNGTFVRDSAGVVLVRNAQKELPTGCIVVAPEPRIAIRPGVTGDADSPALYGVWGGALLSNGTVVVLNAGTQQLLFFSPSGMFRNAVGRKGHGPGEFLAPDWLGHGLGDTLFVWDTRLQRLSIFNAAGEFQTSSRVGEELPAVKGRFDDGSLLVNPISVTYVDADGRVKRDPEEYLRYDLRVQESNRLGGGLSAEWVDGKNGPYLLPFGHSDLFAALGAFFVVGDNSSPLLRFYSMKGELRRLVWWLSEPTPVTQKDKRSFSEHRFRTSGGEEGRGPALFASMRPRFSAIEGDRTGWLWVKGFAAEWEPPAGWLVFDEEGVLRCRVEMPSRFSVLEIGKDYILGRETNGLDEESVVLFDLSRRE